MKVYKFNLYLLLYCIIIILILLIVNPGQILPEVFRYVVNPDRMSLTIQRVRKADEGSLECFAENAVGNISTSAQLSVRSLCKNVLPDKL